MEVFRPATLIGVPPLDGIEEPMTRYRPITRLCAVLAAVTVAHGCGDHESPIAPTPDPSRPTTMAVSPAAANLSALGATVQLAAEVRDQNGNLMARAAVAWSSSAASVASVDTAGLVTAVDNGSATITATAGGASGTAAVTVAQTPDSLAVMPTEAIMSALGDTLRLAAEAFDGNGRAVAGTEFSWSSSDTLVASVDTAGLVTAVDNGSATITATAGGASGTAAVTVAQTPDSLAVMPTEAIMSALGDTLRLAAEAFDGNGRAVAGTEFSWSSSDTLVASVDTAGLVTAVDNGSATITATTGSVSASARITVEQAISAVRVSPESVRLQVVGDTSRLDARALDARDNEVPGAEFSWSSSDTAVASVDGGGLVRAVEVGTAMVTAASGDWRDSSRVVVSSADPTDHHATLTAGLPGRPFSNLTVGGNEVSTSTVGTLRLGLNPAAFPVIVRESENWTDVLVAGSRLGEGRIAAFSGQDFLGPDARATLLGHANPDRLVANAVRWAGEQGGSAPLRALVDNPRIADALRAQGVEGVQVVGRHGHHERDWSAGVLDDVDVVVVLTNHWGTATLAPEFVHPLRAFVERGGGLVVAGSALHWDWWIRERLGRFTGNALLEGTGLSWSVDSIDEIASATTRFDLRALTPGVVWGAYVAGQRLNAKRMALLPGLFSTALDLGRDEEVDSALARLVRETPALPTSSAVPEARLAANVAESLGPHEWPETHPWAAVFPGLPVAGARLVDGTVTVDASRSEFPPDASRRERHLPLGFYAPAGALVVIEVPASLATGELGVSVGELHDHLGEGYSAQPVWRRAPWLRREFPVADRHTAVTNAYGGSIALMVPADYSGTIPVTVRGAIPMAVYTAGRSSADEWFADLDAGAPTAIVQNMGGIRLVISAERARGITDPGEVAAFWDGFYRHHADLAGEPAPRAFESIWIFDPQVGWGYANAGSLRINYPLHGEHWVLVPGTAAGRAWIATLPSRGPQRHMVPPSTGYSPATHGVDWWLFGHELGHQWQTGDWGYGNTGDIVEVAVNLFTMYTLGHYVFGGDDSDLYTEPWQSRGCGLAAPVDHAALPYKPWPADDVCNRLFLYRQLIFEFGWDPIKRVFQSYYDPAFPREVYGGEFDGFAIRFSAIVQRDLVGFFRRWEYPLSEPAAATIRSFGFEVWLPPGW